MIKIRSMIRIGRCSNCYKEIPIKEEVVCTIEGVKHKKLIVLCINCIAKINKQLEGEASGRV